MTVLEYSVELICSISPRKILNQKEKEGRKRNEMEESPDDGSLKSKHYSVDFLSH